MSKVVVTGGNKGIGKACAIKLAKEGHSVVIVVRDAMKAQVAEEIKKLANNPNVFYILGNLNTISGCLEVAKSIQTDHPDINVLINNAGV